jgi:WD40 repeat protein
MGTIGAIAVTPDGTKVVSGSDKEIKVWNINTGDLVHILGGHEDNIDSVAVTPDGTKVVSGSDNGRIKVGAGYG